jgi:DNA-nicking Smr family endonuclease
VNRGICELDVHGLNRAQAEVYITSRLRRAGRDIYRLRIIHGYHGGTELRDMIRSRYKNHPKVLRIEFGLNQGETDLVLREFI